MAGQTAATNTYRQTTAAAEAELRRKQIEDSYRQALYQLDTQAMGARRDLDTSMLGRGVFRSGETQRRSAELEAGLLNARSVADTERANQLGQVESDLQKALLALSSGSGGGGGGGGGGGSGFGTAPGYSGFQFAPLAAPVAPMTLQAAQTTGARVGSIVQSAASGRPRGGNTRGGGSQRAFYS